MIDRASTFADPEIVAALKNRLIPVALDQAYQRRQEDAEGDFYRRIAQQGRPTNSRGETTQGLYVARADGTLLAYTNNRSPGRVMKTIRDALARYRPTSTPVIERGKPDSRFNPQLPEGGLVIRVQAKVLDGYDPPRNAMEDAFQTALSRDNLWITPAEHKLLMNGQIADTLLRRIARFHLVDNTRGEPPMWRDNEIVAANASVADTLLTGSIRLSTQSGDRTYDAELYGFVEHDGQQITRMDIVAKGVFSGEGRYTRGAPKQPFPLAISFTLADGTDVADSIPPQGSRGWLPQYLELR